MNNSRLLTDKPYDCQLCGSSSLEEFVVPDTTVLWYCRPCGLYQHGHLPAESAYRGEYHVGYQGKRSKKIRTAAVRLNRIAGLIDTSTPQLLDVGCSVGCTLEAATRRGWKATGVDVSQDAVDYCRGLGLNAHKADGLRLPVDDQSVDVITAWHVIEHVADVRQTLTEWFRVLRPGGVLVMETPDAHCPKARVRGARYKKFWPPEHTYTFTEHALVQFVGRAGFDILARPIFGPLSATNPSTGGYALSYQFFKGLRYCAGMSKEFQVFARRPIPPAATRVIAA